MRRLFIDNVFVTVFFDVVYKIVQINHRVLKILQLMFIMTLTDIRLSFHNFVLVVRPTVQYLVINLYPDLFKLFRFNNGCLHILKL